MVLKTYVCEDPLKLLEPILDLSLVKRATKHCRLLALEALVNRFSYLQRSTATTGPFGRTGFWCWAYSAGFPGASASSSAITISVGSGKVSDWLVKASSLYIICSKSSFYSWKHASNSLRTAVGISFSDILYQVDSLLAIQNNIHGQNWIISN